MQNFALRCLIELAAVASVTLSKPNSSLDENNGNLHFVDAMMIQNEDVVKAQKDLYQFFYGILPLFCLFCVFYNDSFTFTL